MRNRQHEDSPPFAPVHNLVVEVPEQRTPEPAGKRVAGIRKLGEPGEDRIDRSTEGRATPLVTEPEPLRGLHELGENVWVQLKVQRPCLQGEPLFPLELRATVSP